MQQALVNKALKVLSVADSHSSCDSIPIPKSAITNGCLPDSHLEFIVELGAPACSPDRSSGFKFFCCCPKAISLEHRSIRGEGFGHNEVCLFVDARCLEMPNEW